MIESLRYDDEPFTEQVNVRMRRFPREMVDKLAKINKETKQELFDRLVAEEYERYVVENADTMIAENHEQMAAIEADTTEIQSIVEESKLAK